jgi:hypothetical protein
MLNQLRVSLVTAVSDLICFASVPTQTFQLYRFEPAASSARQEHQATERSLKDGGDDSSLGVPLAPYCSITLHSPYFLALPCRKICSTIPETIFILRHDII